jgi:ABC-2 type transport system permease protein
MKGLVLKDFLLFWKNAKIILVVYLVGIVMSFFNSSASFLMMFITLFSIMWIINLFGLDQQAKWEAYCSGLPVPRSKIVLARYLFFLLLALAGTLLATVDGLLIVMKDGWNMEVFIQKTTESLMMMGGCLIFVSILLPFVYQFGINKARFIVAAVAVLPAIFVSILGNKGDFTSLLPSIENLLSSLYWILPVLGILIFVLSYLISRTIYQKKEL